MLLSFDKDLLSCQSSAGLTVLKCFETFSSKGNLVVVPIVCFSLHLSSLIPSKKVDFILRQPVGKKTESNGSNGFIFLNETRNISWP